MVKASWLGISRHYHKKGDNGVLMDFNGIQNKITAIYNKSVKACIPNVSCLDIFQPIINLYVIKVCTKYCTKYPVFSAFLHKIGLSGFAQFGNMRVF